MAFYYVVTDVVMDISCMCVNKLPKWHKNNKGMSLILTLVQNMLQTTLSGA